MIRRIEEIIRKIVGENMRFTVTTSEKPEFGHYSTNVAFLVDQDPQKLAVEILRSAQNSNPGFFEKVEAKGKFINFWISRRTLSDELIGFLSNPKRHTLKSKTLKINLEFISANPTGPLTMANGRGGFLGDVLANVLEAVGHKVTREYYINDAGNQIRLLGESVLAALGKMPAREEHYKGAYIKELAQKLGHQKTGRSFDDQEIEVIGRLAAAELLKEIQESAEEAGILFHVWFSEYEKIRGGVSSANSGLIKKVLKILEEKGLVEDKDGARWLKTSDISEDKDRVLVKSPSAGLGQAGEPTYFLSDLAYHYDKLVKRKFDKAIDIWGTDHHGYVARLKAGIKAIGEDPEKLRIIITQLVRLVENGQEAKMSKRAGEFITLDELIDTIGKAAPDGSEPRPEAGRDATRFFFLLHTPESHMDFDLSLAKEQSMKNPVYYIQYAYVRCGSILEKGARYKVKGLRIGAHWDLLKGESELNLIRESVKFPDLIRQTAEDYQVNRLARYAMELARATHYFYEKERVIGAEPEMMRARLALVAATREILGRLFDLLGISKPEKM